MRRRSTLLAPVASVLFAFSLCALFASGARATPHRPAWRGIVEGFYGTPWSHADRLSTIRWMGRHGMNLYIYAPKDDPYHREKWREPYPPEQMRRFTELARAGQKNGVLVMVAISPGPSMHYSDPADRKALFAKIDALAAAGVQRFAVFLDDIPDNLQYDDDKAAYPDLGTAHVDLLNAVVAHLREKGLDKPFLTVGTEYWNLNDTPYKRAFREKLDPGVLLMWTGEGVLTPTLTPAMVYRFRQVYGRAPFLWDNYPVNDYAPQRLFLGPLLHRGDVGNVVSGFAMNPMNEAVASRLALFTAADYLSDTARYAPWTSWAAARRETFGPTMATREPLGAIAELSAESALYPGNGPLLTRIIDAYLHPKPGRANVEDRWALENFFTICTRTPERLDAWAASARKDPKNADLLRLIEEVRPWFPAVVKAGEAGLLAMRLDAEPDAKTFARMNAAWAAANQGHHIAGSALSSFIREITQRYRAKTGAAGPKVETTMRTWESYWPENAVDGNPDTWFWSYGGPRVGDTFTVELKEARTLSGVDILGQRADRPDDYLHAGVVEVSTDGKEWSEVAKATTPDVHATFAPRRVRFIRLRATAPQESWITLREITPRAGG